MYFSLSIDLPIAEIITSEGASIVEQSTESKYEKLFIVLGKLGFLIFTWALFGMVATSVFDNCFESISAAHWPSVVGKLEHVTWQEHRHKKQGTHYDVKVEYNYSIDNRQYHNNTLAFGYSASENRENNQLILDKLQHAAEVCVRYNPNRPEQSTLAYGLNSSNTFSAILLLFGFLILTIVSIFSFIKFDLPKNMVSESDLTEDLADESEIAETIYEKLIRAYNNSIISGFDDNC
jgi:Protein of unknown function (DUF3592)